MPRKSAGLLMFCRREGTLMVLLAHMGGPYWEDKDAGAWTIPKGEYDDREEPLDAARREFTEETGIEAKGPFTSLTPVRQPSGKVVSAWAFKGDCDPATIHSNTFTMEWPPHSGKKAEFPEIDRAAWFTLDQAREKILNGQHPLLDELENLIT